MPLLVKRLLLKNISGPEFNPQMPCVVCAIYYNFSTEKIPAHWPDSLAQSVSSRPVRDLVIKSKGDDNYGTPKVCF